MPPDPITKVLDAIPPADERYFMSVIEALHRSGYTGPTTIHWLRGVPKQLDLGTPVKLSIVQPLDSKGTDPPL